MFGGLLVERCNVSRLLCKLYGCYLYLTNHPLSYPQEIHLIFPHYFHQKLWYEFKKYWLNTKFQFLNPWYRFDSFQVDIEAFKPQWVLNLELECDRLNSCTLLRSSLGDVRSRCYRKVRVITNKIDSCRLQQLLLHLHFFKTHLFV